MNWATPLTFPDNLNHSTWKLSSSTRIIDIRWFSYTAHLEPSRADLIDHNESDDLNLKSYLIDAGFPIHHVSSYIVSSSLQLAYLFSNSVCLLSFRNKLIAGGNII